MGPERSHHLPTKDRQPSNRLNAWERGPSSGGDPVPEEDSGTQEAEEKPGFEFHIHLLLLRANCFPSACDMELGALPGQTGPRGTQRTHCGCPGLRPTLWPRGATSGIRERKALACQLVITHCGNSRAIQWNSIAGATGLIPSLKAQPKNEKKEDSLGAAGQAPP